MSVLSCSDAVVENYIFLFQCFEVRGIADFRVQKILEALLGTLGLSTENADPNEIMERTLQKISENEEVYLSSSY